MKEYDKIRMAQIKSIGIKIHDKAELHYDPDFLSGLSDSLLCLKNQYPINANLLSPTLIADAINVLVICPHMEVINPFISILIKEIYSTDYIVDYGVQDFWDMAKYYDIIHIHWPEMFFNWRIPSDNDIKRLSRFFKRESDAIVHLGEYSKAETIKELNIHEQAMFVSF